MSTQKDLVDGLRDAHLADDFERRLPPAAGPANSPDIARIAGINTSDPAVQPASRDPRIGSYVGGTLSGTGKLNAAVRIVANGVQVATTTCNGAGAWSIAVALASGDRVFANDGSTSNMLLVQ